MTANRGRGRILVCLATMAVLVLGAAACGSSAKRSSGGNGSGERSRVPGTSAYGGMSAGSAGSGGSGGSGRQVTIAVVNNPELGNFLVGPDGHTLYLFEADQGTTTACGQDPCKGLWPALAASGGKPVAGSGVDASKLSTARGQVADQVVYNGHLLYDYAGDTKPGQVNGIDIPKWYPVSPSGEKVDAG